MTSLLNVTNLAVYVGDVCLLEPISFRLEKDQPLTILGQTGSGKSLLAQAIMGLLPEELSVSGEVEVFGEALSLDQRRALWGREMVMLPQEPWHALDPLMKGISQVSEVYRLVQARTKSTADEHAQQDLQQVGLAESGHKRPGQLSGGMAQRLAIAAATAAGANLILADEPTKGLDVNRRDGIVRLLQSRSAGGGLLTITHDVAIARQLAGRMMVIKGGNLVEHGDAIDILNQPKDAYTKALIAAEPKKWTHVPSARPSNEKVLEVRDLAIERGGKRLFDSVSFDVHQGEVVGVVGDSGCGKSSLGDALLGLLPLQSGEIKSCLDNTKPYQWLKLYQDPPSAFTASVTLQQLLDDLVTLHQIDKARIPKLMKRLNLPEGILARNCLGVSGGELQRFAILRALLLDPVFLFADEPTSRLDPITAQQVTELLVELARETGCSVLLVSHDPDLVAKTCDQVIQLTV